MRKSLLIFIEDGRFGNIFFHLSHILESFPHDKVIIVCKQDPRKVLSFDNSVSDGVVFYESRYPIRRLLKLVLSLFGRLKLITHITGKDFDQSRKIEKKVGIFFFLKYLKNFGSYFDSKACNKLIQQAHVHRLKEVKCKEVLRNVGFNDSKNLFFLHVRRGDYLRFPSPEEPAVLGLEYYRKAIYQILKIRPDAKFVCLSDDPFYLKDFFGEEKNFFIFHGALSEDFTMMTLCEAGGVLSASSMSLLGALFVRQKSKDGKFIGPMFWAGHRRRTWLPSRVECTWIEYILS